MRTKGGTSPAVADGPGRKADKRADRTWTPEGPPDLRPISLAAVTPTTLQSYKVSKLQSYKVSKLQSYKVTKLQSYKVSNRKKLQVTSCRPVGVTAASEIGRRSGGPSGVQVLSALLSAFRPGPSATAGLVPPFFRLPSARQTCGQRAAQVRQWRTDPDERRTKGRTEPGRRRAPPISARSRWRPLRLLRYKVTKLVSYKVTKLVSYKVTKLQS
jgi:hypothetical protein